MKLTIWSKLIGSGILAAGLAFLPATLPVQAQVEAEPEVVEEENDFDWGWIGLLGLIGLAGLAGRKKQKETVYPTEYTETTPRGTEGTRRYPSDSR